MTSLKKNWGNYYKSLDTFFTVSIKLTYTTADVIKFTEEIFHGKLDFFV